LKMMMVIVSHIKTDILELGLAHDQRFPPAAKESKGKIKIFPPGTPCAVNMEESRAKCKTRGPGGGPKKRRSFFVVEKSTG